MFKIASYLCSIDETASGLPQKYTGNDVAMSYTKERKEPGTVVFKEKSASTTEGFYIRSTVSVFGSSVVNEQKQTRDLSSQAQRWPTF